MAALLTTLGISIHAPREGGDTPSRRNYGAKYVFQSTPPARGATHQDKELIPKIEISIHAPREGGDKMKIQRKSKIAKFQSTPPARGATNRGYNLAKISKQFQSTPPARGATHIVNQKNTSISISIHAPREGGDAKSTVGR